MRMAVWSWGWVGLWCPLGSVAWDVEGQWCGVTTKVFGERLAWRGVDRQTDPVHAVAARSGPRAPARRTARAARSGAGSGGLRVRPGRRVRQRAPRPGALWPHPATSVGGRVTRDDVELDLASIDGTRAPAFFGPGLTTVREPVGLCRGRPVMWSMRSVTAIRWPVWSRSAPSWRGAPRPAGWPGGRGRCIRVRGDDGRG